MRRIGSAVLAVMTLALAAGCASGRSLERWADDKSISAKVKMRIASVRGPGTWIHVDTYDRTVYLTGVVDSQDTKQRVEDLAREIPGVEQVVPSLLIKRSPPPSASVRTDGQREVWTRSNGHPHPLLAVLPDVVRIERPSAAQPGAPSAAFDQSGRRVATIYVVTMRELSEKGLDNLRADGFAIDHVDIFPIGSVPDVPEPTYHVVLWHAARSQVRVGK